MQPLLFTVFLFLGAIFLVSGSASLDDPIPKYADCSKFTSPLAVHNCTLLNERIDLLVKFVENYDHTPKDLRPYDYKRALSFIARNLVDLSVNPLLTGDMNIINNLWGKVNRGNNLPPQSPILVEGVTLYWTQLADYNSNGFAQRQFIPLGQGEYAGGYIAVSLTGDELQELATNYSTNLNPLAPPNLNPDITSQMLRYYHDYLLASVEFPKLNALEQDLLGKLAYYTRNRRAAGIMEIEAALEGVQYTRRVGYDAAPVRRIITGYDNTQAPSLFDTAYAMWWHSSKQRSDALEQKYPALWKALQAGKQPQRY